MKKIFALGVALFLLEEPFAWGMQEEGKHENKEPQKKLSLESNEIRKISGDENNCLLRAILEGVDPDQGWANCHSDVIRNYVANCTLDALDRGDSHVHESFAKYVMKEFNPENNARHLEKIAYATDDLNDEVSAKIIRLMFEAKDLEENRKKALEENKGEEQLKALGDELRKNASDRKALLNSPESSPFLKWTANGYLRRSGDFEAPDAMGDLMGHLFNTRVTSYLKNGTFEEGSYGPEHGIPVNVVHMYYREEYPDSLNHYNLFVPKESFKKISQKEGYKLVDEYIQASDQESADKLLEKIKNSGKIILGEKHKAAFDEFFDKFEEEDVKHRIEHNMARLLMLPNVEIWVSPDRKRNEDFFQRFAYKSLRSPNPDLELAFAKQNQKMTKERVFKEIIGGSLGLFGGQKNTDDAEDELKFLSRRNHPMIEGYRRFTNSEMSRFIEQNNGSKTFQTFMSFVEKHKLRPENMSILLGSLFNVPEEKIENQYNREIQQKTEKPEVRSSFENKINAIMASFLAEDTLAETSQKLGELQPQNQAEETMLQKTEAMVFEALEESKNSKKKPSMK